MLVDSLGHGKGHGHGESGYHVPTMSTTFERSAGVLLHPTCLPSRFGIGDLGPDALGYVEWLAQAGVTWWQVLPLNPPGAAHSPYSCPSSFAGNTLLVSPQLLLEDGLLEPSDLADAPTFPDYTVEYERVIPFKESLLRRAFAVFTSSPPMGMDVELDDFRERHRAWLDSYALFAALKAAHGGDQWLRWPEELAAAEPRALAVWRRTHEEDVAFEAFAQFLFFRQWSALREAANERGVRILGDIPIFVDHDSADVWANRELFLLDASGRPTSVSGVPPDYFSETGQLWGNPLYDWSRMADDGFAWWVARFCHALGLVDAARLDHFRGFVAHWQVPAEATVATNGAWVAGPGAALFETVRERLGGLPFVAEDLGHITEDVVQLRRELDLPGMAILHFGFSPRPRSLFIPYAHTVDLVVYTGTHDNNTSVGWYLEDASADEQDLFRRYAGSVGETVHWDMIRLALGSPALLAVIPHQDLAGLGSDCRMNRPGVADGNWRFRITPWMLDDPIRDRLADLVWTYGRAPEPEIEAGEGET